MLYFSKIKISLVTLCCLIAFYFALPTFILNNDSLADKSFLSKILLNVKVNLGLDLRGGSQLLLDIDVDGYMNEQANLLKEEIKNLFYEESIRTVVENINDKVIFTITDAEEQKKAYKIIESISKKLKIDDNSGQFQVGFAGYEVDNIKKKLVNQSIEIIRRRIDENGTKEPTIIAQGDKRILLQVPGVQNSQELRNILGKTAKMTFHLASQSSNTPDQIMQVYDDRGNSYSLNRNVILSGELLVDASATYHDGLPAVAFRFNNIGSRKFAEITKENVGKIFAIVLDGKVVTAPVINTVINQGSGVISGNFTVKEAGEVALLLRAGALPAPLAVVEERTVGPSLGSDSIKSGKFACVAGLVFVAIFMLIFYGTFGFFANVALLVNIAIIIAVLALLSATLTLPGIAGIVLTIGMSVDANVLIFERIKEEIKTNRSLLSSVEQGFSQAYRTILDSNITTLIVAFFLYAFGNGSVKGFAVTLSIGIMSSMFTAILLTRMLIAIWLKKTRAKKLSLT